MATWWEIWGRLPSETAVSLLAKIPDPDNSFEKLAASYVRQWEIAGYIDVEAKRVESKGQSRC